MISKNEDQKKNAPKLIINGMIFASQVSLDSMPADSLTLFFDFMPAIKQSTDRLQNGTRLSEEENHIESLHSASKSIANTLQSCGLLSEAQRLDDLP